MLLSLDFFFFDFAPPPSDVSRSACSKPDTAITRASEESAPRVLGTPSKAGAVGSAATRDGERPRPPNTHELRRRRPDV